MKYLQRHFERDMKKFGFTYANAKSAIDTEKRLETVIEFFENWQEGNYDPSYELILSYLRDIRDGSVPEYVMKDKKKKK